MPGEFTTGIERGAITRFQRGTTNNGRLFGSFLVNGQEYSVWESDMMSQAEGYENTYCEVTYRQKAGSRFRTATSFVPMLPEPEKQMTQSLDGGGPLVGVDADVQVRMVALVAASMVCERVGQEGAYKVINMARELEAYLLGQDLADGAA